MLYVSDMHRKETKVFDMYVYTFIFRLKEKHSFHNDSNIQ